MEEKKINISAVITLMRRNLKWYIIVLGATFAVSAAILFMQKNYYTANESLAPESSGGFGASGGLSSLASMAGINLNGLGGGDADAIIPDIYPEVVNGTPFMKSLLEIKVKASKQDFSGTLKEYLELDKGFSLSKLFGGGDEEVNSALAKNPAYISKDDMETIENLQKAVNVKVDKKTGMITISTTLEDPLIAATVTDSVSALLQTYIYTYRTKKAQQDLDYAKQLMEKSKNDYLISSSKYANFADSHVELFMEEFKTRESFLENEMQTKYQIYTQAVQQVCVAQAKLQAKIPVYTVVQPAVIPTKKAGPKRLSIIIVIELFAFVIMTSVLLIRSRKTQSA